MGIWLIFQNRHVGVERGRSRVAEPVIGFRFKPVDWERRNKTRSPGREVMTKCLHEVSDPILPRKAAGHVDNMTTVPQTDSGGQVENTKALERTLVKELGKLTP